MICFRCRSLKFFTVVIYIGNGFDYSDLHRKIIYDFLSKKIIISKIRVQ